VSSQTQKTSLLLNIILSILKILLILSILDGKGVVAMMEMTRRVTFSAAHADWLPHLSQTENEARFGSSASPEPYGHNYVLDVGVKGEINPQTGILVNIKEIDRIVREKVVITLHKKYLNKQVAYFCETPATSENIVRFVIEAVAPALPEEVQLASVRVEATPERWVEWRATQNEAENTTMQMTHVYEFAASHRLHSPHLTDEENQELFGKCNYPSGHGHNYIFEVTVAGPIEPRSGRVMDSEALDRIVNDEIVERYDHRHLNYDIPEFQDKIPSAEVITRVIWDRLQAKIPPPARLVRVVVRETARNFFEYRGEDTTEQ
jgi:6-pyruvoyltetrahydropterin/6-carboxytetrahydropterin synthase